MGSMNSDPAKKKKKANYLVQNLIQGAGIVSCLVNQGQRSRVGTLMHSMIVRRDMATAIIK